MKKIVIFICFLAMIGALIFYFSRTSQQKANTASGDITSYRAELSGTYTCLKTIQIKRISNEKCDFGIRTARNEQYALDFNLLSQDKPKLQEGDKFSARGIVTPIEMLSTDYWQKYEIKGIFSVTDSVRIF